MDNRLIYIKDLGVRHRNKIFLVSCLCIHIFWLTFFALNKIMPVIPVNILSVIFYVSVLRIFRHPSYRAIIASYFEIILFSSSMAFILGRSFGFHYYIFGMVVVIYMMTPQSKNRRYLYQVLGFIVFGFCDLNADKFLQHEAYRNAMKPFVIGIFDANCVVIIAIIVLETFLFEADMGASIERLNKLTNMDPLTKLSNRRGLENYVSLVAGEKYCVAMLDIDNFKNVNDTFGHDAGDEVLCRIAEKLKEGIRRSDLASRWGGEEFVVCLPDCPVENGMKIMEKILESTRALTFEKWPDLRVSFTCGITEKEMEPFDETIKRADCLLYHGKRSGKNRIVTEPVI